MRELEAAPLTQAAVNHLNSKNKYSHATDPPHFAPNTSSNTFNKQGQYLKVPPIASKSPSTGI